MMVADVTTGGIVPVKMQDILDPGRADFDVGSSAPTGLAGDYIYNL